MSPEVISLLLVEDERELASVIARELESASYRVTHASNGESALQLALTDTFSLIILDWMLPDISGLDVLRRIRESSIVPVMMLTARDTELDRVLGLEVGADDYLTKPFSTRELIARVRAMLRRRELIERTLKADQTVNQDIIELGGVTLYPAEHRAVAEGQTVELTRTEFTLLYLLLRNPGRVFSRTYLLDTVWAENYIDGDRSVDNAVLRLRKKLKSASDLLETVWGVGYRWKK